MEYIVASIFLLGILGIFAATLLYIASKKFSVKEDPRLAEIEDILPGANCGACGFSGCSAFARACVSTDTLEGMNCTGLDTSGMKKIALIVGLEAMATAPRKAIIRCQNSCEVRNPMNHYDGVKSCAIEHSLYQGESDCVYGCLGLGDCVQACPFGAMILNAGETLPKVDLDKCTGCGKCVEACPRDIPSIVEIPENKRIIWVSCVNKDRGPIAMKECEVACIACTKCKRTCTHEAISIDNFVASIDSGKCVGCGECKEICPRHSISEQVYGG